MSYVISVEGGRPRARVVASDSQFRLTEIKSVEDFLALVGDGQQFYFSSTMDFPRDETRNPKVLALVEALHQAVER